MSNKSVVTNIQELSDSELSEKIKSEGRDMKQYLDALQSRHSGIFMNIVKWYGSGNLRDYQEIVDSKPFIFYETAKKYDPERAMFSTFLRLKVIQYCSEAWRKQKRDNSVVSDPMISMVLDNPEINYSTLEDENSNIDIHDAVFSFLETHRLKEAKRIFHNRVIEGMTWREMAAEEERNGHPISYERCRQIFQSLVLDIKRFLRKDKLELALS